jgi:poly(3-hydroxybutyrate) depolymerase
MTSTLPTGTTRDILVFGRFGFDEFVQHLITFLTRWAAHPSVGRVPADGRRAGGGGADGRGQRPDAAASLTLMAGPIDARVNPTKVNELATSRPIEWFENTLIGYVPLRFAGGCVASIRASCRWRS